MRTLNIFMAGLAASLAIFAACSKQEKPAETPEASAGTTEITDNAFTTLKATASDTKTTADWPHVLWTNGDAISVWSGTTNAYPDTPVTSAEFSTAIASPSATAEFTLNGTTVPEAVDGKYFAAYPLSGVNQWYHSSDYRLYFSCLKDQTAVKDGWDPAHGAMFAISSNNEFSFQHASAYIKFTVGASSPAFKSISVASVDGTYITGRIRVNLPAGTVEANDLKALRSDVVTLSTADGNAFEQGTYYISILPRQYAQGFTLTFENTAGKTATKTVSGDFTFEAGDVANIGTVGTLIFGNPLEIGTAYEEGGVKQGVVYYVDPTNPFKGMIVSASNRTKMVWATQGAIDALMSANGNAGTGCGADLNQTSLQNYAAVVASSNYSATNYPAVAYCESLRNTYGGNWRLPSVEEFAVLFNGYYGKAYNTSLKAGASSGGTDYRADADAITAKGKFDTALSQIEGTGASMDALSGETLGTWYWLDEEAKVSGSTQAKNAYAARLGMYYYKNYVKTTEYYVRCIRDVEVQ